jgi:PAS domain S-box-containing protein
MQDHTIYQTLVDEAIVGMAIIQAGRFIFANPRFCHLVNFSHQELMSLPVNEAMSFIHTDLRAHARQQYHAVLSGQQERFHGLTRLTDADGTPRWLEVTLRRTQYQAQPALHVMIGDVTESKHLEEELRRREQEFRTLAENSPDNIQRLNHEGRHLYANHTFASALGLTTEEVIGKTNAELGIPPEFDGFFADKRDEAMNTQQLVEFDFNYPSPQGERHYHARMIPEFDPDGSIRSLLAVSRDVTERDLARQRQLDLALEQARRRLLRDFIQHAAHEFRTPLTLISTAAYLLESSRHDETQHRKQLERIQQSTDNLSDLLNAMLTMVQLNGEESLQPTPLDFNQVVRQALDLVESQLDAQNLSLHTDFAPGPLLLLADSEYLQEALARLLDNAIRFTPSGGSIAVTTRQPAEAIRLTIKDSGQGISSEARPHVFKQFFRADDAHTTPGFGLGLPIARRIVDLHGGQLDIDSQEGYGTIVTLSLPRQT